MARIQVLPLTSQSVGAVSSTPFVIVIDQLEGDEPLDELSAAVEKLGARALFVFEGDLTVAGVDPELQRVTAAAVERALLPERQASAEA